MTGKDAMPSGTTAGMPQVLLVHHLKQLKLPTVLPALRIPTIAISHSNMMAIRGDHRVVV